MRKVLGDCRATLGEVSNSEHNLRSLEKQAPLAGEVLSQPFEVSL